jgi:VanZ family protein
MHAIPTKGWCSVLQRWILVILWAGLIFYFSTESFTFSNTEGFFSAWLSWLWPGIAPADLAQFHPLLRKGAHWFEYFVFGILLLRAQRRGDEPKLATAAIARTLALVLAYAASDEYHQSWVPERTASAVDVAIDTFGGLCGVFWLCLRDKRRAPI